MYFFVQLSFISNVKPFRGSLDKDCQKGGPFFTLNAQVRKSAEAGDKALKMTVEERLKLVVNLQPSDDEEEKCNGEDDEDMDFDCKWDGISSFVAGS